MSLAITRRPEKTVGSRISRWTALHNPYLFEFSRKDFQVVHTINSGGNARAQLTSDVTLFIFAGDLVYIKSGIYNGVYTVLSVSGFFVTLDTPYIAVGGGGWMNTPILVNYKLYINIYDAITADVIDTLYPKPDSTGLVLFNASGAIKSVLETKDTCTFVYINQKNNSQSGSFYLGYGFSYKFGETQITTTEVVDATKYYWLSAAKQVEGKTVLGMGGYGQNMADYVPLNENGSAAKFLTGFERPTMFVGYPFALSFIYSEDFPTTYLERHQINYNINRQSTSSESNDILLISEAKYLNDLQVADEDATTTQFDVWLETGGEAADGYYTDGYIETGMYSEHAAPASMTSG